MKTYSFLLVIFLFNSLSQAQFENVFSSEGDADKFITEYTRPIFEGLLSATGSGWVTSAQALKPFHFELNINAIAAVVPAEYETFYFDETDYDYLRIENGPNILPTMLGGESNTTMKIVIPINSNQYKVTEFDAPAGIKNELDLPVNMVPAPAVQLSMGLPLQSEINIRYLPELNSNDGGYVSLLGLGFKHSISQYFPHKKDENGKKKKRIFNLAAHASYQNIQAGYIDPGSDKSVKLTLNTINFQGLASFDFKFLSIYSSVTYFKGFSNFTVLGTYEYTYNIEDANGNFLGTSTSTFIDPLNLDFNQNDIGFGVGAKLKLWILSVYADYTLKKFPVARVGIGLTM